MRENFMLCFNCVRVGVVCGNFRWVDWFGWNFKWYGGVVVVGLVEYFGSGWNLFMEWLYYYLRWVGCFGVVLLVFWFW